MASWLEYGGIYVGESDSESEPLPFLSQVPTRISDHKQLKSPAPSVFTDGDDQMSVLSELPQAKPSITSHHRLWAELDSLKDDEARAKEVHSQRGFLGPKRQEVLGRLRETQIGFAQALAVQESGLQLDIYKELWNVEDADLLRARLFSDHSFDLIAENVATASELLVQLDVLSENLKDNL